MKGEYKSGGEREKVCVKEIKSSRTQEWGRREIEKAGERERESESERQRERDRERERERQRETETGRQTRTDRVCRGMSRSCN